MWSPKTVAVLVPFLLSIPQTPENTNTMGSPPVNSTVSYQPRNTTVRWKADWKGGHVGERKVHLGRKRPQTGKRKESHWEGLEKREVAAKRKVNWEIPTKDNAAAGPCSVLCKRKFSKWWGNRGSLTHEEADYYRNLMERVIYSLLYYKTNVLHRLWLSHFCKHEILHLLLGLADYFL